MGIIKFVVPKGSIEEATFQVIENAWQCKVSGRGRIYRVKISDPEIEVKILRPQEIPTYVQEGFHDVGITGKDWIKETNADVKVLLDLEYGKVKQVIAIPEFFKFNSLDELIADFAQNKKTLRFSTEYLKSASQYIKSKENYKKHFGDLEPTIVTPWSRTGDNKMVEIFLSFGATEAKPPEDVDAVFDITETGTTLIQNNLKIIDQVMESTAVLIANKEALKDPIKREKIIDMIVLLRGVVEARKKLHIFVNVEKDNLNALLKILPSLKGPTVSNLSTEGWFGVNTIIDKDEFIRLVPTIRKIAQGLVILEPSQILSMDKVILDDKDEVKID
ncbi:ATP phosphoribosyltransferase [Candidatus Nitrosocosmicus hydrocola]|jgi:ATP phosphoribosyltransferase|uniref:ATP phosphoribosyltransferase n=1 Tax=Candidatus Nitrosocosmicus hydrocola TaxID=1826872 RepID=UPI000B01B074|nr:ATP phosphoribosyltransferase [Candidatus Nitrosocosmicus hydrocola]